MRNIKLNDAPGGLMNANENSLPMGGNFNGQNSLYQLAQQIGQPGTSSINSLSGIMQGENSLNSANFNLPYP
jgi:hypothetical protein